MNLVSFIMIEFFTCQCDVIFYAIVIDIVIAFSRTAKNPFQDDPITNGKFN